MSLEDKIEALTSAVVALTASMQTVGNPFPQPGSAASPLPAGTQTGAPPEKNKGGRPTKEETAAKKAAEAAAAAGAKNEVGDPVGTKYYFNAAHNTAFSVKPGEAHPGVEGIEIAAAEFVAKRQAAAAGKDTGQTAAVVGDPFAEPAAGADPFAAAEPVKPKTKEEVVEHLKKLNGAANKGRDAVLRVLQQFGAINIGGIPDGKLNEMFAAIEKELQS